MYITLDQAKQHLNIDASFHGDDLLILDHITVAEAYVEKLLDRKLDEYMEGGLLPPPLIQAMLLKIGQYYANREPSKAEEGTFDNLISLYRRFTVG